MDDQLSADTLSDTPDYKRIHAVAGGRIQVYHPYNSSVTKFRGGVEVGLPVKNLQNVGPCTLTVAALDGDLTVLNEVTLIARAQLSVFAPPAGTQYLIMTHTGGDGCKSTAVLECDDIPRV